MFLIDVYGIKQYDWGHTVFNFIEKIKKIPGPDTAGNCIMNY